MTSLFKYFGDKKWMKSFLEDGEVYFNSLSYFISCEDKSRKDINEDACIIKPDEGLEITNLRTQQTLIFDGQLNSKVKAPDRIYVFCTSTEFNEKLYQKFNAQGCVEISDVDKFKNRLQSKITETYRQERFGNDQLIAAPVNYFSLSDEPLARHACPDQIVMGKDENYKEEKEYRFAFSLDAGVFDVNNVTYNLSRSSVPTNSKLTHQILCLGSLLDICKDTKSMFNRAR